MGIRFISRGLTFVKVYLESFSRKDFGVKFRFGEE